MITLGHDQSARSDGENALDGRAAAVLAQFPRVAAAWLFGSLVRGEASVGSDADVGLLLRTPGETARENYRWVSDLAGRLEAVFGRPVDVVVLDAQGPVFCHHVLAEGRLIYEADRERRIDFESETTSRFLDFRPTWEIAARASQKGLRDWLERRR